MQFEVRQLEKSFGDKKVLQSIDFSTTSGKAFGLLGRNGAGKTTTIRIIMGVFPPDGGQVLLDGTHFDPMKNPVGYLPEERGLYPKKKINEQLMYLAELRGMKPADSKPAIAYWLERMEMGATAGKKLDTLSKGNQQKIQLAAALITNPDFVILDEPFSGLDPVNAQMMKDIVKELIADGKIVLFSSHQMNYVEEFCDDIAILHQGKIVLSGSIDGIKRSYDRSIITIKTQNINAVDDYCSIKLADLVAHTEIQQGELRVKLKTPQDKLRLMAALAAQGLDVDAMAVYEPSLNDIFVQYTGHDEADQKAGESA